MNVKDDHRSGDVTRLLLEARDGSSTAEEQLFDRVYAELHDRAQWQRRHIDSPPTLNTTALVNEVFLKLIRQPDQSWQNRAHFFAVAGKAMRHLLINYVQQSRAQKRGGGAPKLSLEQVQGALGRDVALTDERSETLLLLDEVLDQFEKKHPRASRVVECRFFGGMTIDETSEALGVSTATVSRDWNLAQAWLYRMMRQSLN